MANIGSDFKEGFEEVLKYGQLIRIKYFNPSYGAGSYYDDDITLTQSGSDLWISGVVQPIDASRGSSDTVLLEQGKILTNDTKLYVEGATNTSGTFKIGLGSPPSSEYSILREGIITWDVNAEPIVNKLYIRRLTNGSLMGEI